VVQARMDEQRALDQLEAAARQGKSGDVEAAAKKSEEAQEAFVGLVRLAALLSSAPLLSFFFLVSSVRRNKAKEDEAGSGADPAKKARIDDIIAELDQLLPEATEAARRAVQNPKYAFLRLPYLLGNPPTDLPPL